MKNSLCLSTQQENTNVQNKNRWIKEYERNSLENFTDG